MGGRLSYDNGKKAPGEIYFLFSVILESLPGSYERLELIKDLKLSLQGGTQLRRTWRYLLQVHSVLPHTSDTINIFLQTHKPRNPSTVVLVLTMPV